MLSATQINTLTLFRRTLHANPEVSEQEFETQRRILDFLEKHASCTTNKVGKTGVLATFESKTHGPSIVIRGDIDALPITEINDFEYKSKRDGVSHKCGHDGHTTILLGLAQVLSKIPLNKGKVALLFQPAEENGMGAQAILDDKTFQRENIDYIFALHNLPGYKTHQIVIKEHEFTANVKSIIIKLTGKTSHAAEPEKGLNPSMAISEIFAFAHHITHNHPEDQNFFLMTPIFCTLGDMAYGISAGYAEVHFTIRSWLTDLMAKKSSEIITFCEQTCKKHNLKVDFSWTQVFHANINDPSAVHLIKKAANLNDCELHENTFPFRWGEDFGLFTQKFKGAMFGVGAGVNTPALHNPDYDYPDEITETGVNMFYQIINQIL